MNRKELQIHLAERHKNTWNRGHQDILAITNPTDNDALWKKFTAFFTLNKELCDEFSTYSRYIDQKDYRAADAARDDLLRFYDRATSIAFCKLLDSRAIYFTAKPEGEALEQLENIEIAAGVRPPRELPPVAATAEETLRDQVIEDFKTLPTAKFKMKLNGNVDYRAMFEQLSKSGGLTLKATSLTNAGA